MKLSIITINRNNSAGLEKTLRSVNTQTCKDFEHLIIDGASTDNSVNVIENYGLQIAHTAISFQWLSEPDSGIYNAMNKGICMANGDYIQILNSGDILASDNVVERMLAHLQITNDQLRVKGEPEVSILYGNMIKVDELGKVIGKSYYTPYSLLQFYTSTLNHDCAYIKRVLFDAANYGLYDESLKIVSDWKWYLQAIGLGFVKPIYVDIDVTIFEAAGISETNLDLRNQERRQVLEMSLPPAVLADYDKYHVPMVQMNRLLRYKWAYWCVWFLERCLFKWEKWIKR